MQAIKILISEYILQITIWAILSTLAVIIITITNTKRKRRYMSWKKDRLNLLVFSREWERNDDKLTEELFSENERLSTENKALKSEITKFSIIVFIIYAVYVVSSVFKRRAKYTKN